MSDQQSVDISEVTPEQFVGLVKETSDEDLAALVRAAGTEAVLDRIFQGMQERFQPDKATDVDAVISWTVTDEGAEHSYTMTISNGSCSVDKGAADDPRVGLTTDLVSFSKLITGQAQGPQLFMAGKLKVKGDIMFSARITGFFDQPTA